MSNFQNPITTTRLPKEDLPIFEFDDTLHVGSPNPSPNKPSSMKCEPTSSHPGWDIVMPRLGTQASRSPTPEIDQAHPHQIQRRDSLLDTKPGFFRSNNSYISHWECCKCKAIHKITDQNKAWLNKVGPQLQHPRDTSHLYGETCSNVNCRSIRCSKCFDLEIVGTRGQYCNGDYCERKRSPRWAGGQPTLSPSFPVTVALGPGRVGVFGTMKVDLPQKKQGPEECHQFTGQNGAVKEEYPKVLYSEFPRKAWKG